MALKTKKEVDKVIVPEIEKEVSEVVKNTEIENIEEVSYVLLTSVTGSSRIVIKDSDDHKFLKNYPELWSEN